MTALNGVCILLLGSLLTLTNLLLKQHLNTHSLVSVASVFKIDFWVQHLTSPWLWGCAFSGATAIFAWIYILQRLPLSVAYPASSLTYIIMLFADALIFGTPLTPTKICGVLLIMGGIFAITR